MSSFAFAIVMSPLNLADHDYAAAHLREFVDDCVATLLERKASDEAINVR